MCWMRATLGERSVRAFCAPTSSAERQLRAHSRGASTRAPRRLDLVRERLYVEALTHLLDPAVRVDLERGHDLAGDGRATHRESAVPLHYHGPAVRDQRVHFDPHASSDRKLPHEFVDDRLRSTMRAIRTVDPNRILSEELGELLGLRVAP